MLGIKRKLHLRSAIGLSDYSNKVKELQMMTIDRDNLKKALADKTKEYDNNLQKALNSYQSRLINANRRMVRQLVQYKVAIKFAYYNEKHQILYKDTTADQVHFTDFVDDSMQAVNSNSLPCCYIGASLMCCLVDSICSCVHSTAAGSLVHIRFTFDTKFTKEVCSDILEEYLLHLAIMDS